MKKLILLSILIIIGCDNSTEPEDYIHPIVGVWDLCCYGNLETNSWTMLADGWWKRLTVNNNGIAYDSSYVADQYYTAEILWKLKGNNLDSLIVIKENGLDYYEAYEVKYYSLIEDTLITVFTNDEHPSDVAYKYFRQ